MNRKIAIGGDHAGFEYKTKLVEILKAKGFDVKDFGPFTADSCDYPDYVHPLAKAVENQEFEKGIIICGSANGVNMVANKYQGVRSALCWLPEIAELARSHNDANIVAIPARFVSFDTAQEIANTFLSTDFEGGRHQNRVDKIRIK
jgi:ribose 5-phosphate isomerase B